MPNIEDVLRDQTYKGQFDTLEERIYSTLAHVKNADVKIHRVSKTLALLMRHLHDRNLLSEKEIDNILLEILG